MTTTLQFSSSEWPPSEGGKRIAGKYLNLLQAFVRSIVLAEDQFLVEPTQQYEELVQAMAKVFHEHLTVENAQTIIFRQCMFFEIEHKGRSGPLAAPENQDLFDALVGRLKSFFESIPRRCTLRIELPLFVVQAGLAPIAPDVKLISSVTPTPANTNKLLSMALAQQSTELEPTYLEITVDGFGEHDAQSPAASAALSIAKQFAFLVFAYRICHTGYSSKTSRSTFSDSANSAFSSITIPEGVRRSFSSLKLNDSRMVMYDWLEPEKKCADCLPLATWEGPPWERANSCLSKTTYLPTSGAISRRALTRTLIRSRRLSSGTKTRSGPTTIRSRISRLALVWKQ
ncbi:hypothetical protein AB4Z46_04165 [Variovorax sp. M-6]|uniref:hypothetical protein n=1 Tax=Variovorax sp. M-6 TaxID=3233041 RepID=UPI003F956C78